MKRRLLKRCSAGTLAHDSGHEKYGCTPTPEKRFEKRTSRVSAHLPSCIGEVSVGDTVKVMECRPLSKTVSFCVVEISGGEA